MVKCLGCNWFTDKCKNPNSRNFNKFADDIKKCKSMLIDKKRTNEITFGKRKDDSI